LTSSTANVSSSASAGEPTVLYLIGRIDRVVRRAIADVVRPHALSVNQYVTLSVLDRRDGLSNAQLARRALVSPQAMNEVLLTLEDQGLVRRRAHPAHGRIRPTRLTAKGRKLLARCDAEVADIGPDCSADSAPGSGPSSGRCWCAGSARSGAAGTRPRRRAGPRRRRSCWPSSRKERSGWITCYRCCG
jgi:DNA-binding MarR family transcriptional regulator